MPCVTPASRRCAGSASDSSRGLTCASTKISSFRSPTACGSPPALGSPTPSARRRSSNTSPIASATARAAATSRCTAISPHNGYVAVRVDMRGSGESDGLLDDEYLQRELDDACEVIAWLSRQPWCDGNVGMMGKSWGGFNALQVAALRPPALKAIITVCSTDDRYADDIHYMGGALLNDNLWWGAIMLAYQARPPDPAVARRLARGLVAAARRHAVLAGALAWSISAATTIGGTARSARISRRSQCPVFAVGGWADAYTNAIPRLLEGLQGPAPRPDRPVGASLSPRRQAGSGDRLPAGGAALVGPLVEGRDSGRDARADAARLHRGRRRENRGDRRRPLRRRGAMAVAADRAPRRSSVDESRPRSARAAHRARRRLLACWTGAGVGEWMGTGAPHEDARGPAARRRLLALFRQRAAEPSALEIARRAGRSRSRSPPTSRWRRSARGSATSARTAPRGASPTACSISPIATATPSRAR